MITASGRVGPRLWRLLPPTFGKKCFLFGTKKQVERKKRKEVRGEAGSTPHTHTSHVGKKFRDQLGKEP